MTLHTLRPAAEGAGLPLVLLHAFPLDHRMWQDAAARLPGARAVLAIDLPGAGTSHGAVLPEPPSLEAAAAALARELDAAGVPRAVVAGLSMGGYVALALLERRPGLVAGLGLVDTKSSADTPEARANRLRVADEAEGDASVAPVRPMVATLVGETTRSSRPDVLERVAGWVEEQAPASVAWAQRAMAARPDRTDVLAAWDGPVAVVVGDEDTVTPVDAARHMADAAPQAQLVVVPRAGHLSAVEQPDAVALALGDLCQRADA
ncbi:alpha/beta fold hydrolase [Cellulomonas massiliensis]|uniref:alpha/beta fold hydrolase n=1 Tax=Cellulomonas massiliensis TaxID=1465811 RepID=UPI000308CC1A|nr:alpha/beta fold hydrolase [Cellulomonas massiliensis]